MAGRGAGPAPAQGGRPMTAANDEALVIETQAEVVDARPGSRFMWPVEAAIPVRGLRAGLYAMHLPADDGHEGWRFGAQTDATVLQFRPLPLQGLLTMGAGMVHSDLPAGAMLPPPTSPVRSLSPWRPRTDSETALSLSSGVAARLPISDGTAFRLDLRRVWDLGEIDAAATELSAGFTLPLRR